MAESQTEPVRHRPWIFSPLEDDGILSEILRRLPPWPSFLLRASLVCRRWRRVATSPSLLRDFRAFHRDAPPLLGVFHNSYFGDDRRFVAAVDPPDPVPITRFRMPCPNHWTWRFLDCRHGRALLLGLSRAALVWDPITGARHRLPPPPDAGDIRMGAVLCGHVHDCRSSPFQVVLIWWKQEQQHRRAVAAVYSSMSGAWSQVVSSQFASTNLADGDAKKPGTLVGNAIYWLLAESCILEFDTVRRSLALIPVPIHSQGSLYWQCQLVLTEHGDLGLAMVTQASILLWKRDASPRAGAAGWLLHRSFQLDGCLPPRSGAQAAPPSLLGFHEESNVIFVWIDDGVFMIQLESMRSRMVCQGTSNFEIYPFAGFYTGGASEPVPNDDASEPTRVDDDSALEDMPRWVLQRLQMWHYQAPDGSVHGPFSMVQLMRWEVDGFFPQRFMVWMTDQTKEEAVLSTKASFDVIVKPMQEELKMRVGRTADQNGAP